MKCRKLMGLQLMAGLVVARNYHRSAIIETLFSSRIYQLPFEQREAFEAELNATSPPTMEGVSQDCPEAKHAL